MERSPILKQLIANRTADALELTNGITLEVRPASFRTLRGPTYIAVIADELVFWYVDAAYANQAGQSQVHAKHMTHALRTEGKPVVSSTSKPARWASFFTNPFDPYSTYPWDEDPPNDLSEEASRIVGRCWFVWSDESDGWIYVDDLPEEKWQALQRRMEREQKPRERKRKMWEAARAAHPMYEVVPNTHWLFPDEIEWKGDGEEPSWDALIEWFKVNHPAQASEVEREMAHHDLGDPLP